MRHWMAGAAVALTFSALPMFAQADTFQGVASYSHSLQWDVRWTGNLNGCDPILLDAASGSGAVALVVTVDGAPYPGRTTSTWTSPGDAGLSITGAGAAIIPFGSLNRVTYGGAGFLTCGPHTLLLPSPPAPVPTLSEWAMILLAATLTGGALWVIHRRKTA
jgi:hypothetical protein